MSSIEKIAIAASLVVAVLQALKYDNDKSKDRIVRILTALFAVIIIAATAWNTSRSQAEDEIKTARMEQKQKTDMARLDSTHRATVHILDSTNSAYLKTIIARDLHTREEIKRYNKDNLSRLDYQYANNMSHTSELFGLISKRTVEEYLAEKVPNNMSLEETNKMINAALNLFIQEEIAKSYDSTAIVSYDKDREWYDGDTTTRGCWVYANTKFKRNLQVKTQTSNTFWDACLWSSDVPDDHKYVSVIIDDGSKIKGQTFITDQFSTKSRDLYIEYTKWYSSIRNYQSTHQTYSHILILVLDDNRDKSMDDALPEEMNLWAGYERQTHLENKELLLYFVEKSELKNVKIDFE